MGVRLAALLALSGCSLSFMRTEPMDQLAAVPEVDPDCSSTYVYPALDVMVSITEGALAYLWTRQTLSSVNESPGGAPGAALVALLGLAVVSVATAGSSVHGFGNAHACRKAHAAFAELAAARQHMEKRATQSGRAWALAKDAALAARRGDCELVKLRDREIAEIDLDLHDTVFLRDVAVARCLK